MAEGLAAATARPALDARVRREPSALAREYSDEATQLSIPLSPEGGKRMIAPDAQRATSDVPRIARCYCQRPSGRQERYQLFENPTFHQIGARNSLAILRRAQRGNRSSKWHSPADVLIPSTRSPSTTRRCKAGTKVTTMLTPSPEHMSAAVIGVPATMEFLSAFPREPASAPADTPR